MAVRPFDPTTERGRLLDTLERVFRGRVGTWAAINVGQRVDPHLMRLTRGRVRLAVTAPTVLLTHTGAKSGKRRRRPCSTSPTATTSS